MTAEEIISRYNRVEDRILEACASAGRKRKDVTLIAVSKFQPESAILAAAAAGQADFGENYMQEALAKERDLLNKTSQPLRWHMIGHVQSRKAAAAAGAFELIHTVDSEKLAHGLEKKLAMSSGGQDILIEVNVGEEKQKSGVSEENLFQLADVIEEQCPHLRMLGLMCIPPVYDAGDGARPYFAKLASLREKLKMRLGRDLPHLSMGMSGDFPVAIAEGATLIRIGTAIFGPRPVKNGQ